MQLGSQLVPEARTTVAYRLQAGGASCYAAPARRLPATPWPSSN